MGGSNRGIKMERILRNPVSRIACWYLTITLGTIFPFLGGCATKGPLQTKSIRSESAARKISSEMSLAHGRMRTTINGEPWNLGGPNYIVIAQSEENFSGWLAVNPYKSPGSFYLELAPGSYRIMSMRIGRVAEKEERLIEPLPLTFDIPEAGKVYYLGDMTIDLGGEKHFWKSTFLDGIKDISIVDNYNEATNMLINMSEYWEGKSETLLMKQDDAIGINDLQLIKLSDSKYSKIKSAYDDASSPKWMPLYLLITILGLGAQVTGEGLFN